MNIKTGTKVITPDGPGMVAELSGSKILVTLETDKYWPHWNIYYNKNDIK